RMALAAPPDHLRVIRRISVWRIGCHRSDFLRCEFVEQHPEVQPPSQRRSHATLKFIEVCACCRKREAETYLEILPILRNPLGLIFKIGDNAGQRSVEVVSLRLRLPS